MLAITVCRAQLYRRVLDPLAELVKIDPRSLGVGMYQHDVDQKRLRTRLDDVVPRLYFWRLFRGMPTANAEG